MDKELTYIKAGDYYIPNLALAPEPAEPVRDIGKYGRMRKLYLQAHRPGLYNSLLLSGTLYAHLLEIDQTARKTLGTDDAGDGESRRSNKGTESP